MSEGEPGKPRTYIKACVLMCKRDAFQLYLSQATCRIVSNEEEALKAVRLLTGIRSRTELIEGSDAGEFWKALITDFNNKVKQ